MFEVDKQFFTLLESFDVTKIARCDRECINIVLPLLTRCSLCAPADHSSYWQKRRQLLLQSLLNFDEVNFLIESLSTDFNEVSSDCRNKTTLRNKQVQSGGIVLEQDDDSLARFETFTATQQLKMVVTEVKWLMVITSQEAAEENTHLQCPQILELQLFRKTVTDLLCIALHELPSLLPIPDVIGALLHVNGSLDMIKKILLNSPWSVAEVCCSLIIQSKDSDSTKVQQTRTDVIKFICRLSQTSAAQAAKTCIAHNKLPQVLAWIYLNQSDETSLFKIAEFIFTHKRTAKSLLLSKTQSSGEESPLLAMIRKTLDQELSSMIDAGVAKINHNRLFILIRLYACLREIITYKFADYELEKLFKIFPSLPLHTDQDMQLMILALCLIITSIHQMAHYSQQLSSWLRSLAHNTKLYTRSSDTSIGQFLLLIAIHYHGNQLTTISEMVSTYLNIKSSTVKLSNTILKQIVTCEVFTEPVISQLTVLLSVTKRLNANIKGYLPIHCVCQLLKSRAFSKHNVSIAEWITSQLSNVALPLHPMIPRMISQYVASTMPQQHNVRSANPQLDESRIQEHFTKSCDTESNFASQLVFLHYVLSHQESINSDPGAASRRKSTYTYSNALISSIPTKLLLTKAYQMRHQCGSLYPSLVKLLYSNLPHMCKADMWLPETSNHRRPNTLLKLLSGSREGADAVDSIHKQYIKLRLVSESLSSDTLPVLLDTIRIVQASPIEDIPRHMTMVLTETWLAYSRIAPERLYPETVNVLRGEHNSLSEEQMVIDPLLVLQCLSDCRQPDMLTIVLHLINIYSRASHRYFNIHSQTRQSHGSSALSDAQEICYSLMSAQESATLQILLEQCLPIIKPSESILCNQREIQTLICSDIHKLIIDNPYQAKLVSFQGYDRRLIPVAISGIPSMHICLDYIPELLAQPDINKQVFAVRLTASLSRQYGVHKTFTMAKLCINTLVTLIGVLPTRSLISNILPVLPEVVSLCQNMPVLYDDWIRLLAKVLPVLSACQDGKDISKHKNKSLALSCS